MVAEFYHDLVHCIEELGVPRDFEDTTPEGRVKPLYSTIDVDSNLRYGKKTRPMGRLKIDMPSILPNKYLMATPSRFEAIGHKDASFTFGGRT